MSSTIAFIEALDTVGVATASACTGPDAPRWFAVPRTSPLYDKVFDAFWMRGRYEMRHEGPDRTGHARDRRR